MHLKKDHLRIIGECLHAAANGPFFPDGEFSSLFGLTKEEVARGANQWPVVIDDYDIMHAAINNSMNYLLCYPIKHKECWDDYISIARSKLSAVFAVWLNQRKLDTTPRGFFDRLM